MTMPEPVHPRDEERGDAHPLPLSRRKFLGTSAMAVAGGVLFSCTGGRTIPSVSDRTPATDTATPIKRVIYVMLENRSFNNIFGSFPGVEGTDVGVSYGKEVPLRRCPDWLPGDLPHDRAAYLNCMNGGALDGFGTGIYGPTWAYSQMTEAQVPNYWGWAREYALSDHFFASAAGPSYPNHFFMVAGTSGGVIDNPENIETRVEGSKKYKSWGCDAIGEDVFVLVKDETGNLAKHDTCFTFPTVGEQLSREGVDWAFYSATPGQTGYFWNAYNGIEQVFHSDLWQTHMRPVDRIVRDIKADRLPAVTWVTPRFELSDHPPCSTGFSHNWISDIVDAVMTSDMWQHTAMFITWDEWGGFYDPVAPPVVDDIGLGFRVPLLTISPYTPRGLIDDQVGEFSTPLRFIADNWGLRYLTPRIRDTHDMTHLFDFKRPPRSPQPSNERAKTYGSPWVFPTDYPGWPKGTVPAENPF
jgi:phospholipase C